MGISIVKHKPIRHKQTLSGCHYVVIMYFHTLRLIDLFPKDVIKVPKVYIFTICDLLSENPALPANIKFELLRDDFIRTGRFSA